MEDSLLDLTSELDEGELTHVMGRLLSRRSTTPQRLQAAITARSRLPHRKVLMDVLADVASGAVSTLAREYLRRIERAHGLPVGHRQSRSLRYVSDVRYDVGLIVELDGRAYHRDSRFQDMWRDNDHC